jgi:AraC-like DNA-binding protein
MGRGVLRPDLAATRFSLARFTPSGPLAPFVDYYWIVRWDLRGQPSHEQTILPHPNVHLAFEASGAGIYGVDRSLFTRRLSGRGKAVGARFRAGCFRPFWGAPISQLSDRVVPATRVFGPLAEKTRQAIMCAETTDADMTSHAESLLFSALPERDPVAEQVAGLVALITSDPALQRVDQLSSASGLSVRSLQRMFADYVGVSPKWVMRRARLHEAASRADGGEQVDWAALALDLGYADQAHLTRDLSATIGVPPGRYRSLGLCYRNGAQVRLRRRAAAGGLQCVADRGQHLGRLGADLPGREGQHHDAVLAHPALSPERPGVILRRHVPLVRVDLDRDAELRPPCVRPGHERIPGEHRRVEQRHRQPGRSQQVLKVTFRGRPDPLGNVAQRLAEQRRSRARPGVQLRGQVRHVAFVTLHGVGHDRPDVPQAGQVACGIGDRPGGQGVAQRAELTDSLRHPRRAMQPGEGRVLASS